VHDFHRVTDSPRQILTVLDDVGQPTDKLIEPGRKLNDFPTRKQNYAAGQVASPWQWSASMPSDQSMSWRYRWRSNDPGTGH